MRVCIKCGADISAPELRQKILCPNCKREKDLEYKKKHRQAIREQKGNLTCVVCGKEFPRWGTTNVCSDECRKARYEQRNKIARRKYYLKTVRERRGVSDTVSCIICGKDFPRNGQTKACSPECKQAQYKSYHATARANQKEKKKRAKSSQSNILSA